MPDNEEVQSTLEALISENESGLLSVWKRYQITKPLTSENMVLAYHRFGEPFAQDVDEVLAIESFSGVTIKDFLDAGLKAIVAASALKNLTDKEGEIDLDQPETEEKKVMGIPSKIFNIALVTVLLLIIFLIINYTNE